MNLTQISAFLYMLVVFNVDPSVVSRIEAILKATQASTTQIVAPVPTPPASVQEPEVATTTTSVAPPPPLKLVSRSATVIATTTASRTVRFNWETSTETTADFYICSRPTECYPQASIPSANRHSFTIERSRNGVEFYRISIPNLEDLVGQMPQ